MNEKEIIDLLVWSYVQGYNDAAKILNETKPNTEELKLKLMAVLRSKGINYGT